MKLLLGVYGMQEADAREFVKMANEMGADIKSYALRIGKIAVERYLQENTDTSVVIVSEALEAKSPYEVGDFERIIDIKNDLTIIPILNNETEGTEKILGIFNLGIYNAIYAKDAMGENVARLIVDPRSRKLAKSYYRIQDAMENTNGANIEQCVEYILSGEKDELPERAVYIKERVSKTDFLTIKSMLPYEIQEVIMDKIWSKDMQRIDKISEIVEKEANEKAKTVKKAKSENATCYIDGIKQDSAFDPDGLNIYDYDILYKNNRLYFKTIKKSEYTSSMNNGSGWYFPLYFPVFR